MRKLLVFVVISFFSFCLTTTAQNRYGVRGKAKISPVRLLPGYKVQLTTGADAVGGIIWKDGGMKIDFGMGLHVGVASDLVDKSDVVWREEQVVNGAQVICVYTKSHDFIVSFPRLTTNFQGKIRSQRDLAEMLIMVLTFEPTRGYPVESGTEE